MNFNKKDVLRKSGSQVILIGFIFFIGSLCLWGQEKPVLIKDPKPTHIEKNFVPLRLVHKISTDFSEENFFARPSELAVDHTGNLYVYDDLLNKILKFDAGFKFVKAIGSTGEGPGEFSPARKTKNIGISGNKLIVWDYYRQKMILLTLDGGHVKDIKFRSRFLPVFPCLAGEENHFIVIANKNIEVWDKHFKRTGILLAQKDYNTFLVHLPIGEEKKVIFNEPGTSNTWIRLLSGNRCIIYQSNSSTVYIYKDWKLTNRFDIRPAAKLQRYKSYIPRLRKKLRSDNFHTSILNGFFIDRDNEKYLYFSGSAFPGDDEKYILYRFSLDGKLVNTLLYYNKDRVFFYAKRNDLFYGIDSDDEQIFVFKEEKNEKRN